MMREFVRDRVGGVGREVGDSVVEVRGIKGEI